MLMPGAARACPRSPAAADFLATAAARPVVVADLVAPALSADGVRAGAAEIAGFADACLTGDHPGARVQFPPSYQARLLADEGVTAWAGISCRDRNRVALEGEIAACADAGVAGVHCVTGDHPGTGHRPDAASVFDLDSVGLVELARAAAALPSRPLCSVAHAPGGTARWEAPGQAASQDQRLGGRRVRGPLRRRGPARRRGHRAP
jgi:hypothetical protein